MTIKNKTILITGGAGFIGSTLADKLLLNNKIIVIDNFDRYYSRKTKEKNISANLKNKNYTFYKLDITNKKALERIFSKHKIDIVVHLAAKVGIRNSLKNPESYVKTNILGTVNLLEIVKKNKINKMIFASSSSVYGNCNEESFSEDLSLSEPISPYAATKLAGENFCYMYHKLHGLKIICLRFFTVYGPRQRPDLAINLFSGLIKKGKPIPVFGDGNTQRNYSFVDDIVNGIILAIKYDKTNYEIVNLGGDESIRLDEMIKTLETTIGKNAIIDKQPIQECDMVKTVADITKAKKLLGYEPKTNFSNGIKMFIEFIEKNN